MPKDNEWKITNAFIVKVTLNVYLTHSGNGFSLFSPSYKTGHLCLRNISNVAFLRWTCWKTHYWEDRKRKKVQHTGKIRTHNLLIKRCVCSLLLDFTCCPSHKKCWFNEIIVIEINSLQVFVESVPMTADNSFSWRSSCWRTPRNRLGHRRRCRPPGSSRSTRRPWSWRRVWKKASRLFLDSIFNW